MRDHLALADLVELRLLWGREHALTIAEVAVLAYLSPREVQKGIEELRRRGAPIVTGSAGVWLSADADEILDSYRRLRRRALRQLANLRTMQRTAEAMRRPLTIWDPVPS